MLGFPSFKSWTSCSCQSQPKAQEFKDGSGGVSASGGWHTSFVHRYRKVRTLPSAHAWPIFCRVGTQATSEWVKVSILQKSCDSPTALTSSRAFCILPELVEALHAL